MLPVAATPALVRSGFDPLPTPRSTAKAASYSPQTSSSAFGRHDFNRVSSPRSTPKTASYSPQTNGLGSPIAQWILPLRQHLEQHQKRRVIPHRPTEQPQPLTGTVPIQCRHLELHQRPRLLSQTNGLGMTFGSKEFDAPPTPRATPKTASYSPQINQTVVGRNNFYTAPTPRITPKARS